MKLYQSMFCVRKSESESLQSDRLTLKLGTGKVTAISVGGLIMILMVIMHELLIKVTRK